MRVLVLLTCISMLSLLHGAERINHAGRILPDEPAVTTPLLFNTPEADAKMASLQIMPRDYAGNDDISTRPVLPNSDAMIAQIEAGLDQRHGTASWRYDLRGFFEMNWVLVPDDQPQQDIYLNLYPDESDDVVDEANSIARYPIPDNKPVETWPRNTEGLSLGDWQRDVNGDGGDRHSIVLQPGTGYFWETWLCQRVDGSPEWEAANLAKWNVNSRALRPLGWTSGDAAGLPLLPYVVRYDEVQRGEIEHALRMIVYRTRRAYLYPATHQASVPSTTDPDIPAMGERLRLKASFVIPEHWTDESKCVARALKRYGGIVADNGGFLSFSISPDDRWPEDCFQDLRDIQVADFEVIDGFGENEGPRSANPLAADVGPDLTIGLGQMANLSATVTGGTGAVSHSWYVYPHATQPGTVNFGTASATTTTATFSAQGEYILMFKASDGIHTPAYDAIRIQVGDPVQRRIDLNWTEPGAQFEVFLNGGSYSTVSSPNVQITSLDPTSDHTVRVVALPGSSG